MKKGLFAGLVALLFLPGVVEIANADIMTASPSGEGYFSVGSNGTSTGPYYNNSFGIFVGKIGPNSTYSPVAARGANEFDINALSTSTVNSANFSFQIDDPLDAGISSCFDFYGGCPGITGLEIFGYAGDGTVDLTDADAGTWLASMDPLPSFGSNITFDVTSFINGLVNTNDFYAGFNIRAAGLTGGGLWLSNSSLTIDYTDNSTGDSVPEPATMLLFGTGLVGLVGSRLRKKKK